MVESLATGMQQLEVKEETAPQEKGKKQQQGGGKKKGKDCSADSGRPLEVSESLFLQINN